MQTFLNRIQDFVSSGSEGGGGHSGNASEPQTSTAGVLTEDEKNKIHAKILKAEMKGDMVGRVFFCNLLDQFHIFFSRTSLRYSLQKFVFQAKACHLLVHRQHSMEFRELPCFTVFVVANVIEND